MYKLFSLAEATTVPVIIKPTTPEIIVRKYCAAHPLKTCYFLDANDFKTNKFFKFVSAPCTTKFYHLVDGPSPLPDNSLKASSSKDSSSGPQSARLSSVYGAKSGMYGARLGLGPHSPRGAASEVMSS